MVYRQLLKEIVKVLESKKKKEKSHIKMRNTKRVLIVYVIVLILNILMAHGQEHAAGKHGIRRDTDKIYQTKCFIFKTQVKNYICKM